MSIKVTKVQSISVPGRAGIKCAGMCAALGVN
ncbi:MAG: methanobactin [Gallionella sp.]|nr:methanobactin [Gallionella sp.]